MIRAAFQVPSQYPTKPIRFVVGFAAGGAHLAIEMFNAMAGMDMVHVRTPELGERLALEGSEPGGNTPDEFAAFIKREIAKWAKVVRESGLKAE